MSIKSVNKDPSTQQESFSELLVQLAKSSAVVVHDEIELVIQRISEMAQSARNGVLLIVTGAVLGFAAFMCFCTSLIIGLSAYMSPVMATLVTGLLTAITGGVIALTGYRQFKK